VAGAVSVGVPGGDSGVQQVPVGFSFTTITIQEMLQNLITEATDLREAGMLNDGQANSLIIKLERALDRLNRGNPRVAINNLEAFINEISSLEDEGVLSTETAQALIDRAARVIGYIQAG
jgi:hypothetical protein